jgi:hypothetical protein
MLKLTFCQRFSKSIIWLASVWYHLGFILASSLNSIIKINHCKSTIYSMYCIYISAILSVCLLFLNQNSEFINMQNQSKTYPRKTFKLSMSLFVVTLFFSLIYLCVLKVVFSKLLLIDQ